MHSTHKCITHHLTATIISTLPANFYPHKCITHHLTATVISTLPANFYSHKCITHHITATVISTLPANFYLRTSMAGLHTDVNLGPGRTAVTARWVGWAGGWMEEDWVHLCATPLSSSPVCLHHEGLLCSIFLPPPHTHTVCSGLRCWTYSVILDIRPSQLSLTLHQKEKP